MRCWCEKILRNTENRCTKSHLILSCFVQPDPELCQTSCNCGLKVTEIGSERREEWSLGQRLKVGLKVGNLTPHLGLNEFKLRRHPIENKIQTDNKFEGLIHIKIEKESEYFARLARFN